MLNVAALRTFVRSRIHKLRMVSGKYSTRSYSQFGEDIALLHFFGKEYRGFFVDVGVLHPYVGNNTYLLYEHGWTGLNIEPNPFCFPTIKMLRPKDINVMLAVSNTPGTLQFECNGSFSGLLGDDYLWQGSSSNIVSVEARTLSEILEQYVPMNCQIDVLDVDCEGHDLAILSSNEWDRFRPTVILVEFHVGMKQELNPESFLKKVGYRFDRRMGPTMMWVESGR